MNIQVTYIILLKITNFKEIYKKLTIKYEKSDKSA